MGSEIEDFAKRFIESANRLKLAEEEAFNNPIRQKKEELVVARRQLHRYAIPFVFALAHSSSIYEDHDTNRVLHFQQSTSKQALPDKWQENMERFWLSLEELEKAGKGKQYESVFDKAGQFAEQILDIAAPTDKSKHDMITLIAAKSDYWESILLPTLVENRHDYSAQAPRREDAMTANDSAGWDAFICHAGEDKQSVAEPLARELHDNYGLKIWLDRWELKIGDSLRRKIDEGLSRSRYGIVVISPAFFQKEWPQKELDGLVQREINGQKVILPVWHKVTQEEVLSYSPILADRMAGNTKGGISQLAQEISHAIQEPEELRRYRAQRETNPEEPVVSGLQVEYKRDPDSTGDLHLYWLIVKFTNTSPAKQVGYMLELFFPHRVPVESSYLESSEPVKIDGEYYQRVVVSSEEVTIYRDHTVVIVDKERNPVKYKMNNSLYGHEDSNKWRMLCNFYVGNLPAIKENRAWKDMHCF